MDKVKIQIILFLCISFSFSGCITDYVAKGLEEERDLLVVEGLITNDQSTITLSRSVGLTEIFEGTEYINNARVWVESEDGNYIRTGSLLEKGEYWIETGELNANTKYRLRISLEGEEYESDFLSPLFTPEIDSLFYIKAGKGEPVFICVSTHDLQDQSRYYRWSYNEVWEIKADLMANARWNEDGRIVLMDFRSSDNTYYCWGYDHSKTLILDTSEKLKENIISRKKLVEIPTDHDKISQLYYIAVEQTMIRKEAYDYFTNLQKNIESSSSIFAPIPSETYGNIKCTTTPGIPIVGYIDVATTVREEKYIPASEGLFEPVRSFCYNEITELLPNGPFSMAVYQYDPPGATLYAPYKCVDCTMRYKATKKKPDFWPNDHL